MARMQNLDLKTFGVKDRNHFFILILLVQEKIRTLRDGHIKQKEDKIR